MTFSPPNFEAGELEIRQEGDEICIYGTPNGLRTLAELCIQLAATAKTPDHVHLEDYSILTGDSTRATIGVFDR